MGPFVVDGVDALVIGIEWRGCKEHPLVEVVVMMTTPVCVLLQVAQTVAILKGTAMTLSSLG